MQSKPTLKNSTIVATSTTPSKIIFLLLFLVSRTGAFAVNVNDNASNHPQQCSSSDDDNSSCAASKRMTLNHHYHPNDPRLKLFHFDTCESTQDEAKKIIAEEMQDNRNEANTFCVTATEQTKGRGTSGRDWLGAPGNVFVTVGMPVSSWPSPNVPLTLLPLKVGALTATLIQQLLLEECQFHDASTPKPDVTVKWPNDVLVERKKISGTLIESSDGFFLIGVGINLAYAPSIPTTIGNKNHGRPSTSVQAYCCSASEAQLSGDSKLAERQQQHYITKAQQVGVDLAYNLHSWLVSVNIDDMEHSKLLSEADSILQGWKQYVDWDMELVMRDTPDRERVKLREVLPDGRVRIQSLEDGTERVLVSDYFL